MPDATNIDQVPRVRTAYVQMLADAEAVAACKRELGDDPVLLLIVFCGRHHDPETVRDEIIRLFGDIPIVGGSSAGCIATDALGYTGFELCMVGFVDPRITPQIVSVTNMLDGDREAGLLLGERVRDVAAGGASVMLFYDSVRSPMTAQNPVPTLHYASALMQGFNTGIGDLTLTVVGGGLLTHFNLYDGWVFIGDRHSKHAACALVFPPCVKAGLVVMSGCVPASTFMTITKCSGAEIFELDGVSALSVLAERLGLDETQSGIKDLPLAGTLGAKQGDIYAPFEESAYINRLILSADLAAGSIRMFEPDLTEGQVVQIMSRNNDLMIDSAIAGMDIYRQSITQNLPFLSIYIDCAGRAGVVTGARTEEAEIVGKGVDPEVPFIGFYSGVEIAPFEGSHSRPLDWTGVLVSLSL